MTEPTDLPMTEARRAMLQRVHDGLITYDTLTGRWRDESEGSLVGGWAGRTLAELRRADYILVLSGDAPPYTVDLSERGRSALAG